MTNSKLLAMITQVRAIADTGLLYTENPYDIERYEELRHLSTEMLDTISGYGAETINILFPQAKEYPTAKVDIRGVLLNDVGQLLLTREMSDGNWSLPGGWADVGYSPRETVVKEFKEETGLDVEPLRLLAIFDKKMHAHPPQGSYVYKIVFQCKALSDVLKNGHDVLDVQYFDVDKLPELSDVRIVKGQIEKLLAVIAAGGNEVIVD